MHELVIIETGHVNSRFKHEVNVNFTIEQATKEQTESRGIDLLLPLAWALDGVGGKHHAPVTLPPVKKPATHTHGRSGRLRTISHHRDSIPGSSSP